MHHYNIPATNGEFYDKEKRRAAEETVRETLRIDPKARRAQCRLTHALHESAEKNGKEITVKQAASMAFAIQTNALLLRMAVNGPDEREWAKIDKAAGTLAGKEGPKAREARFKKTHGTSSSEWQVIITESDDESIIS